MNDPLPLDPTRGHFKDSLVRQWSYTGSAQPSHPTPPHPTRFMTMEWPHQTKLLNKANDMKIHFQKWILS